MQNTENKTIKMTAKDCKKLKKVSSNIARGYISRAGIINLCLA